MAVKGWVRTKRDQKAFSFVEINDGSCMKGVQVSQREEGAGGGGKVVVRETERERDRRR